LDGERTGYFLACYTPASFPSIGRTMKKITLLGSLLWMALAIPSLAADHFKNQASIPAVDSAGFYRILLSPEVIVQMKSSAADVRLFDRKGENVPFIFREGGDKEELLDLPALDWKQEEGQGQSRIRISSASLKHAEKLLIEVDGPRYFYRTARIVAVKKKKVRGRLRAREVNLERFVLSSDQKNLELNFGHSSYDEVFLVIENGENPPLRVKAIAAQKSPLYLLVWLEKGEKYQLRYGNPKVHQAHFDLNHFASRIPDELPVLLPDPGKIRFQKIKQLMGSGLPLWVIWLTLMVLVVSLSLFSIKLIRNLDSEPNVRGNTLE